jgi:hypothetical protein
MVGGGSDAPLQLIPIVLQNKKLHERAAESVGRKDTHELPLVALTSLINTSL